jgi:hypothetical protein
MVFGREIFKVCSGEKGNIQLIIIINRIYLRHTNNYYGGDLKV